MSETTDAQRISILTLCAQKLAQAVNQQQWIEDFAIGEGPLTLDEAYIVQDIVAQLRPDRPSGWKLGATSTSAQLAFGVSGPFIGRIFAKDIYFSPATISRARADMLIIEGEFVFQMREALPVRHSDYTLEEVRAAIGTLHPAIEYVQSRYRYRGKLDAVRSVADNAGQGAVVIGEPIHHWRELSLEEQTVDVCVDNVSVAKGHGRQAMGNPLTCMHWLANFLRRRGLGLQAGEYVTTGTCTGATEVPAHVDVIADFAALGKVKVCFNV